VRRAIAGLCASLASLGLAAAFGCAANDAYEREKVDAYARGYAAGLAERSEPEQTDCIAPAPPAELAALAVCRADFDRYRQTEAANRANARQLGLNEGLRIGREDWSVQPWECRGGFSDLARAVR
jgi:hypothetical protein